MNGQWYGEMVFIYTSFIRMKVQQFGFPAIILLDLYSNSYMKMYPIFPPKKPSPVYPLDSATTGVWPYRHGNRESHDGQVAADQLGHCACVREPCLQLQRTCQERADAEGRQARVGKTPPTRGLFMRDDPAGSERPS